MSHTATLDQEGRAQSGLARHGRQGAPAVALAAFVKPVEKHCAPCSALPGWLLLLRDVLT